MPAWYYGLVLLVVTIWLIGLALMARRSPSFVKQERDWTPRRHALVVLSGHRRTW